MILGEKSSSSTSEAPRKMELGNVRVVHIQESRVELWTLLKIDINRCICENVIYNFTKKSENKILDVGLFTEK